MTQDQTTTHTICITCGYNLAGLPETGLCPECATPCEESFKQTRFVVEHAKALYALREGLLMAFAGYALLTTGTCLIITHNLFYGTRNAVLQESGALAIVAFGTSATLIPFGLYQITRFRPEQHIYKYSTLLAAGTTGMIIALGIALPVTISVGSSTSHIIFSTVLSLSLFAVAIGLSGIASYTATRMGIKKLNKVALITRAIACPVFVVLATSSITHAVVTSNHSGKHLLVSGGQWQDILYISLAALTLLHTAFTFYFWRKLRSRLGTLKP